MQVDSIAWNKESTSMYTSWIEQKQLFDSICIDTGLLKNKYKKNKVFT